MQKSFLLLNLEATREAQVRDENNHTQSQFLVQWLPTRPDLGGCDCSEIWIKLWNTLLQRARPTGLSCPCSSDPGVNSTARRTLPSFSCHLQLLQCRRPCHGTYRLWHWPEVCFHGHKQDTQQLVSLLNEFIGF